jgi:Asp-tRNA(Asn)/Glu-tRNA(Gln) amidotransferase A subunit family amidase
MAGLHERSAVSLAASLRRGDVSATEVVSSCLEAITGREGELRAWAHLDPELALARARELDALDQPRGPLHGLPVGVKDIIDTADQPTQYGTPIYEGFQPTSDAAVVSRLRAAGAVILGKTVTTEFALFHPGPTSNPHDGSRTPGGSSSGSAAAVGARTIPLAVGTQTAGSVVRPASFCGIVGVKPTFGAVPTEGVRPCAERLDTVGSFGRDVADAALLLGVMAGRPERFRPADLGDRPRIGFCRTHEWDEVAPSCRSVIEEGVGRLAREVDVVEVDLPASFEGLARSQTVVMLVETAQALTEELRDHPGALSATLHEMLAHPDLRAELYEEAVAHIATCRSQLDEVFRGVDALVAPSVLSEAPPIEEGTADPLLCRSWTALGTPAVSVPGLTGRTGLPLGVQVVAPLGADDVALGAAELVGRWLGDADAPGSAAPAGEAGQAAARNTIP